MNSNNVTWLDISPINISFQGLACIIDSLQTNTRITELHLSGKLTVQSAFYLQELIESTLIMHSCQIGDKGAAIFGEMLTVNHSLKRLSLHDNLITDIGEKSLEEGLKHNSTLENLSINLNRFIETLKHC